LDSLAKKPGELSEAGLPVSRDGAPKTPRQILAYQNVAFEDCLSLWPELQAIPPSLRQQLKTDAHYAGYLSRQKADIDAMRKDDALLLPASLNYYQIGGLSAESQELLTRYQPETLGQAGRIPGLTPAALVAVLRHLKKGPQPQTDTISEQADAGASVATSL